MINNYILLMTINKNCHYNYFYDLAISGYLLGYYLPVCGITSFFVLPNYKYEYSLRSNNVLCILLQLGYSYLFETT